MLFGAAVIFKGICDFGVCFDFWMCSGSLWYAKMILSKVSLSTFSSSMPARYFHCVSSFKNVGM